MMKRLFRTILSILRLLVRWTRCYNATCMFILRLKNNHSGWSKWQVVQRSTGRCNPPHETFQVCTFWTVMATIVGERYKFKLPSACSCRWMRRKACRSLTVYGGCNCWTWQSEYMTNCWPLSILWCGVSGTTWTERSFQETKALS